jgi:glutathione S-transferase
MGSAMKIYDREGFPNPIRVRVVVAAKRLEPQVEWVSVDLIDAEHKQPPFLAKNPSGVVPVLELDDGTFISESTAITTYLDNLDNDPILTGRTPLERAIILMMQRRAEAYVIEPVGNYFHYGTPGWGTKLPPYKALDWAGRTEWGAREFAKTKEGLRYFDQILRDRPFITGDTFTMPDITLFAGMYFAKAVGYVPENSPALLDWHARVSELPAVKSRTGQNLLPEDLERI